MGRHACASPEPRAGDVLARVRVPDRDDDAGRGETRDRLQRPGELGSQGHDPRPGGEHAIHGGCVRREQLLRIMGPPLAWTQEGALLVYAEDASMGSGGAGGLGGLSRRGDQALQRSGDDGGAECGHTVGGEPRRDAGDRIRPGRRVLAAQTVDLQVAEPGRDDDLGATQHLACHPPHRRLRLALPDRSDASIFQQHPTFGVDAGTVQQVAPEQTR